MAALALKWENASRELYEESCQRRDHASDERAAKLVEQRPEGARPCIHIALISISNLSTHLIGNLDQIKRHSSDSPYK